MDRKLGEVPMATCTSGLDSVLLVITASSGKSSVPVQEDLTLTWQADLLITKRDARQYKIKMLTYLLWLTSAAKQGDTEERLDISLCHDTDH